MSCQILLEFHGEQPQLSKTLFKRDNGDVLTSVRGKTAGAVHGAGSFQWTSAVKAVSAIMLRAAIGAMENSAPTVAMLSGFGGSLASTLDYALSKQPSWTVDMFGVDACGHTFLRRLLLRTNPERKYPGPVIITPNSRVIAGDKIEIWWNGRRVNMAEETKRLLALIEGTDNAALERAKETANVLLRTAELKSRIENSKHKVALAA